MPGDKWLRFQNVFASHMLPAHSQCQTMIFTYFPKICLVPPELAIPRQQCEWQGLMIHINCSWYILINIAVSTHRPKKIDCSTCVAYCCGPWSEQLATTMHFTPVHSVFLLHNQLSRAKPSTLKCVHCVEHRLHRQCIIWECYCEQVFRGPKMAIVRLHSRQWFEQHISFLGAWFYPLFSSASVSGLLQGGWNETCWSSPAGSLLLRKRQKISKWMIVSDLTV